MSERAQIIRMAQQDIRPAQIARILRCKPQKVSDVLKSARKAGWDIPRFQTGPANEATDIVIIPSKIMRDLRADAEQRGMHPHALVTALVTTVAAHNLVNAVLDMELS